MTESGELQSQGAVLPFHASESDERLKFSGNNDFHIELRRRIDEFFERTGRRRRDCPQMYLKTAILLVCSAASYIALVFLATAWWQAAPLTVLLGLATASIGFNIQHDGGHHAYSDYAPVNKLAAMTLDLVGGSCYLWRWKHGIFHTYVNIDGEDSDITLRLIARLTPHQRRLWFHRWQQFYLWPLYGLLAMKWHMVGDFRDVITGRIGKHRVPRPKGLNLVIFLAGKALFFTLVFVIPLLLHPVWVVASFYAVGVLVLGITLSVVFQLAHCVEQAEFPLPQPETGRIDNSWAIHQIETTVNFARGSRIATWLLGGLNFQIEHHLFPKICHVNYPAISKVVESTCRDFTVNYIEHKSFWGGVGAHFRWLRQMGMPEASGRK